jgi:hypothetical protein
MHSSLWNTFRRQAMPSVSQTTRYNSRESPRCLDRKSCQETQGKTDHEEQQSKGMNHPLLETNSTGQLPRTVLVSNISYSSTALNASKIATDDGQR